MSKFQVGDIVEAFGNRGVVTHVDVSHNWYPIVVEFDTGTGTVIYNFTLDGKQGGWHKEPSLKLIRRPNKKVKKWVNLYISKSNPLDLHGVMYNSLDDANTYSDPARIACVEIEVEED